MTSLESEIADVYARSADDWGAYVARICTREGAPRVVEVAASLVACGGSAAWGAVRFLRDGAEEVPALAAEVRRSDVLAEAVRRTALGAGHRERASGVDAIVELPIADRELLIEECAMHLLAHRDVIALSALVACAPVPRIVAAMIESEDWIVRWSLLPYTNAWVDDDSAKAIRTRLADDAQPLVAAEAKQHLAILAAFEQRVREVQGWTFGVVTNHGAALSFRDMTHRFVASWAADKDAYSLDELREFALGEARRRDSA